MTSILNAPYTADILVVSKLILIISYCAEGGRMQSLCHRFVVCFTIIIWSFGVAAARHEIDTTVTPAICDKREAKVLLARDVLVGDL